MSRLFSGARNLFNGVKRMFGGQTPPPAPTPAPPAASLFSGQIKQNVFSGQVPIAPGGATAPNFAIGTDRPLTGPDGKPINPEQQIGSMQVFTFASLWNTTTKTYSWRWDEAYARCREDALAMRRDAFVMGLLFERKYPTAQMPWHIEPDDKKNARQMAVADYLKSCIDTLPNVSDMLMTQLEHIWYGRAGNELHWVKKQVRGMDSWCTEQLTPVNGDKVQFEWDGTPQIRLYGGVPVDKRGEVEQEIFGMYPHVQKEDVAWTDRGMMLRLARPYWRDRYIISKHDCIDADFYESEKAGGVHGVGIRHWIYWFWWIRQEVGSYLLDFMERTGLGFTVYYYDPGNPRDFDNVKQIAQQQGRNTWIVWPRQPGDKDAQKGVERIEPNTSGASYLVDMLAHYDGYIERFIVGQTMSGGSDNESGLGGSGRAKFAQQTKTFIIRNDCLRTQGYLSTDFVRVLMRMNKANCEAIYGGPLDFECRWMFDIEVDDPEAKLKAGSELVKLGVKVKADELRSAAGYSKPADDDEIVGGQPAMPVGAPGQPAGAAPGKPQAPSMFGPKPGQPEAETTDAVEADANAPSPATPEDMEQPKKPIRYVVERGGERVVMGADEWESFVSEAEELGGELAALAKYGKADGAALDASLESVLIRYSAIVPEGEIYNDAKAAFERVLEELT